MAIPASFDLITAIGKAYSFAWHERRYLLRLAALPFLLKLIFFTLGYTQGGAEDLWRMTLIMVPAWMAEGWMLAHFVRLILLGQRWPFRPSGDLRVDLPVLQARYRGVMGGLLAFTLIQLLVGGWFAVLMGVVPFSLEESPGPVTFTPGEAVASCVLLGTAVYFFRFLWLFIPVAAGTSVKPVAARLTPGMGISLRFIGIWMLCAVPAMIVMQLILGFALMLAGPEQAGDISMMVSVVAKVVMDLVKNILCAAAATFVFREIMADKKS